MGLVMTIIIIHQHTHLLSILKSDNHWVVPEDRLLHNNRLGGHHSHLSRSRLHRQINNTTRLTSQQSSAHVTSEYCIVTGNIHVHDYCLCSIFQGKEKSCINTLIYHNKNMSSIPPPPPSSQYPLPLGFYDIFKMCIVWISLRMPYSEVLVIFADYHCLLCFLTSSRWTKETAMASRRLYYSSNLYISTISSLIITTMLDLAFNISMSYVAASVVTDTHTE